jgi:hypothetical protein
LHHRGTDRLGQTLDRVQQFTHRAIPLVHRFQS